MSFIDLPVLQAPPVLKPPSSLVVRYGHMRMMGEFPYDGDTRPGCGAKVVIRTKRGTERLAKRLNKEGFAAAMIHGDRSQSQRNSALAGFQQGRYRVLVATDVASRGIHVQDIAHVINFDLPEVAENFIHVQQRA